MSTTSDYFKQIGPIERANIAHERMMAKRDKLVMLHRDLPAELPESLVDVLCMSAIDFAMAVETTRDSYKECIELMFATSKKDDEPGGMEPESEPWIVWVDGKGNHENDLQTFVDKQNAWRWAEEQAKAMNKNQVELQVNNSYGYILPDDGTFHISVQPLSETFHTAP